MHSVELGQSDLNNRIFLLEGEDLYWKDYALGFFKSLVPKENVDTDIKFYDKLVSLEDIIFTLSSYSFNDGTQLIIVSDEAYKADKKELSALSQVMKEDISPYILVFDGVKFLTAAEKKLVTLIDCEKLDRGGLMRYAAKLFPSGIDSFALGKLIDYTRGDMAKISLESQKLLSYAEEKKITADMVDDLVAADAELKVFSFISSLSSGNKQLAVKQLDTLLKNGESKAMMLAMLIGQYRRMLHSAISPLPSSELALHLGTKEFAVKKCREMNIPSKIKLKKQLEMLVDYEYKIRCGEMTEGMGFDSAICMLLGG